MVVVQQKRPGEQGVPTRCDLFLAIITNKKIADTKTKTLISEKDSTLEMNKKLLQDAAGEVNKIMAEVDGSPEHFPLGRGFGQVVEYFSRPD